MGTSTLCAMALILCVATVTDATHRTGTDNYRPGIVNNKNYTFLEASNQFSVDLMKVVFKQPGNFIISPLTVSTLLAMLQQGARETTLQQLNRALHINSREALTGFEKVTGRINHSELARFKFGNSMFVSSQFTLVPSYQDTMLRHFHAAVESVDFSNPIAASLKINKWVSNVTEGRIAEIITEGAISGRTRMVLVSAMYFKGSWLDPFHTSWLRSLPFFKTADRRSSIDVDMLRQNISLKAGEDKDTLNAKWIDMAFAGYQYSMLVVLPNDNLDDMLTRMTGEHLANMVKDISVRDVILTMPKFKFNTDLSLLPSLKALGLTDMFSQRSNLAGIATSSSTLVVSGVIHKAQIDVHENGTEAAAVSSISVETLSLPPTYEKLVFMADKPFLAVVIDKASSLPLFVAKVADPSKH